MFDILLFVMTAGYLLLAAFIILIVLIQPGKSGGGLGGLGGGSTAGTAITETLGATQAEKSLGRWTMYAGAAFGILALALTLLGSIEQRSMLNLGEERSAAPVVTTTPQEGEAMTIEVPPMSGSAPTDAPPASAPPTDAPSTE